MSTISGFTDLSKLKPESEPGKGGDSGQTSKLPRYAVLKLNEVEDVRAALDKARLALEDQAKQPDAETAAVAEAQQVAQQLQTAGAALKDAVESGRELGHQATNVARLEAAATLGRISIEGQVRVIQQAASRNNLETRDQLNTAPVVQPYPVGGAIPMTVTEVDGIVLPQDGSIEIAVARGAMRDWGEQFVLEDTQVVYNNGPTTTIENGLIPAGTLYRLVELKCQPSNLEDLGPRDRYVRQYSGPWVTQVQACWCARREATLNLSAGQEFQLSQELKP